MTSAFRTITMAIAAVLLMHIGGMAVAPVALHAPVSGETAHHAVPHHVAGHAAPSAETMEVVLSAWSCIDGVATSQRTPLPVVAFVAIIPVMELPVLDAEAWAPVHRAPAPLDAAELRAFLQVFLN